MKTYTEFNEGIFSKQSPEDKKIEKLKLTTRDHKGVLA